MMALQRFRCVLALLLAGVTCVLSLLLLLPIHTALHVAAAAAAAFKP
jgi:hypothetical protein